MIFRSIASSQLVTTPPGKPVEDQDKSVLDDKQQSMAAIKLTRSNDSRSSSVKESS